ncbi:RicAFT regulatory complex protein RicA family protein [Saccharibacillus sp. JS10]|uniref:RicAFT regulatory complex protein RicA family protein n=1 Tax=Saccharibacillus sp. JS10 TaxID=2950552 RepID=UPI00210C66D7|nr:YlbF family regulator [Saccharibacillus sp. JS10]MCQ4087262.1 YlbF family regulator [Saccharibacillus sp. JS10]
MSTNQYSDHPAENLNAPTRTWNRSDILDKTKELAGLISSSEEVRIFQQAERQINGHERIQYLITTIKKKQKEVVAFEAMKNAKMAGQIEAELQDLQDELDGIPIVSDYQEGQVEINDLLQMVVSAIHSTVSEKIAVERGADTPPSSCG